MPSDQFSKRPSPQHEREPMATAAETQGPKGFFAVSNPAAKGASSLRRIAGDGAGNWLLALVQSSRGRIREMRVPILNAAVNNKARGNFN